ncbi:CsbD family protein [Alkaliphilus serpentinus]|uniref:CsbD family protein n=1 Tax=Alkaliphilus serpentinus TaxID=1482731 RepID=A0A833HNU4_9FIRM|nr:CsbD family protein [Alkaliphilus serpentinus]KAB3530039.1 CsbD family protein [Alkaliphilus serpentinus]
MVKNVFKGKWNQLKGTIKETWGKLDDDVIMEIDGNYDVLIGKLQELYGVTKEEAESEVAEFLKKA